jgi:hypothetical protein
MCGVDGVFDSRENGAEKGLLMVKWGIPLRHELL